MEGINIQFMLPQKHPSYASFTYDECKPDYWPQGMDRFVAAAYKALDEDYDLDPFKLFIMKKWADQSYKPTADDFNEIMALEEEDEYPKIDFNEYGDFIKKNHDKIDVLFFLKILEKEKPGRPLEENRLYKRFSTTEYDGEWTFSVPAMLGNRRHAIWLDTEMQTYRDVATGEKAFIGTFEKWHKDYVQSYVQEDGAAELREAERKAKFQRACMVTALSLDEKAWRPGNKGLFKGLSPDRAEQAGIRFCNHDRKEAEQFGWSSMSVKEKERDDPRFVGVDMSERRVI